MTYGEHEVWTRPFWHASALPYRTSPHSGSAWFSQSAIDCVPRPHIHGHAASVQVRVNLWDLAGPEDYREVRNEFYQDAQVGTWAGSGQATNKETGAGATAHKRHPWPLLPVRAEANTCLAHTSGILTTRARPAKRYCPAGPAAGAARLLMPPHKGSSGCCIAGCPASV